MLNKFATPTPDLTVIRLLNPVNRYLNLQGMKWFKCLPFINQLPFVKGLCDITRIHIYHEEYFKESLNQDTACFITPNHPEFYTDWMLDKEISARFAPCMASWATHEVVNGMGNLMQKFWLKNNLIAQIPGSGNKEAKAYSIAQALKGNGVLLHPEGHVSWESDHVSPLFSGVVDMACEAYEQAKKPVYIVPVIWKLKFNQDVEKNLQKELNYVEKDLKLPESSGQINERLHIILGNIFNKIIEKYNLDDLRNNFSDNLIQKQKEILSLLVEELSLELNRSFSEDLNQEIALLGKIKELSPEQKKKISDMKKLDEFNLELYQENLTQEHIAEILKKIRIQFCIHGIKNQWHKFVPTPVGSRTAHIEILKPLLINKPYCMESDKKEVLNGLRISMQNKLNEINQKMTFITYSNPWFQ